MTKIAFLGLGAMGSRMAARLLAAGHDLTVWNRSAAATGQLAALGARVAPTPRAAAARQEVVIAMLRDDAAAAEVWLGADGALRGIEPDAVGVECSTLSLPGMLALVRAFADAGHPFVDAPVVGSRPQAEAGALVFLTGGAADVIQQLHPVLLTMGAAVQHAGGSGAGCLAKLYVNAMFGAQLALTGEFVGMIRKAGFDPASIVEAFAQTPVASPALKLAGPTMLGDTFPAAFPIDLLAKDFAMLVRTGGHTNARMPASEEVGRIFAAACREGLGPLNATGIVKRYDT